VARVGHKKGVVMRRSSTLTFLGLALLMLSLLASACSTDPTTTDEFQALEEDLAQAEAQLAELTAQRDAMAQDGATGVIAAVEANETAHIEAFLSEDLDALMDTYTEDAIWVDETYGDYFVGKPRVRSMLSSVMGFTDPNASGVLERFVAEDGTFAASTWEWIGTNAFGTPFDLPYVLIDEYRDGKIAKQTIYYASPDSRQLLAR